MKPRKTVLFFALTVAIFCKAPATQCRTTSPAAGATPDLVAQEFYKWYIHSVSRQIDPLKTDKPTLKKFVTTRLILKIERIAREMASGDYDGDYFLEAQRDYPDSPNLEDEWIKNMSTSKLMVKGATAALTISFGENGVLAKERIRLIQEGGFWRIDDVKSANGGVVKLGRGNYEQIHPRHRIALWFIQI